jgi:hypothetical protein
MTLSSISRISHSLCNLVSSLVSSRLELSLLLLALSISSLLKLLSADCGQFTDLPGSLCVVLKNTGCAFSHVSSLVSCLVSFIGSSLVVAAALLSALCSAPLATARLARLGSARASRHFSARSSAWPAHGSSWLTALLGSTWLLLCSLLSALLCLRLLAAPPLARRGFSRLAALLGPCDSVWHDWLGSRLPAQLGSAWLDWLGSHGALTGCWHCSA